MNDLEQISVELYIAISAKNADAVRRLCREHPWLISDHMHWDDNPRNHRVATPKLLKSWTVLAAREIAGTGDYALLDLMLALGFNINALDMPGDVSAVEVAIDNGDIGLLRHVLSKGADLNLGRPIISALHWDRKELQIPLVTVLLDNGADVNKLHSLYGDMSRSFTALDYANRPDAIEFLRSRGAKPANQLRPGPDGLGGD